MLAAILMLGVDMPTDNDIRQIQKRKRVRAVYPIFHVDNVHSVDCEAWQLFIRLLEDPPKMNEALRNLMFKPSPWEK